MKTFIRIFYYMIISTMAMVCTLDAAFKDIGWSARSMGMGGAFTAISDDSSAILYNPAGLVQAESYEVNLMYARLFAGLDEVDLGLNYGAFLVPTRIMGNFAVNWANFLSKDQYREDIISLAYARNLNELVKCYLKKRLVPEISFGINIKYLVHSYSMDERTNIDPVFSDGDSKAAYAVDIGIWSRPLPDQQPGLLTGVVFKNINQPDVGLKSKDIVPMEVSIGVAYKIKKIYKLSNILPAMDFTYRNQEWGKPDDKINIHAGIEAWALKNMLGFRLGGNYDEISAGFSLKMPEKFSVKLKIDYAFLWPMKIKETLGTHRIAVTYKF